MQEFDRFNIPPTLLQQLNEFSYGGFLLFTYDDQGSPRYYAQFDNELNMMALQKASEYWLESVHDINAETIKSQLCGEAPPPSPDDNEYREDDWTDEDDFSS
jgi:hypothetical protein|tara:strand:- start:814 stop:1119 length:306 start_codon:yes stop_codon:yes gene_type:complete